MIIRWICEKDNKKWIYPIEKCVYCRGPIKKQVSRKAKVIGMTKVNIPSPMHPLIPYNIILLEDEFGSRMPKKTMKEYQLGDSFSTEKAKYNGAVIITKIKYDSFEALRESFSLLKSYELNEDDKVLVKPSIIEPAYSYQAITTSPKLLDSLFSYLKEKGVKDIISGEQAMLGNDVMEAAKKSGILDVCKKHGVQFFDLGKEEFRKVLYENFEFSISRHFLERKVISVPVLKTNSQLTISGAMENMIRITDGNTQKRMFADDIEKTLPLLMKAVPAFLTIGDGTIGLEGQGPTLLGEPAFLNILYLSKNPVALDVIFASASMLEVPDYLRKCAEEEFSMDYLKSIEVVGEEQDAIKFPLKAAETGFNSHPRIRIIDGRSNPLTFNKAIGITSKLIGLSGHEMCIAIGKYLSREKIEREKRIVAYGSDAIGWFKENNIIPLAELGENIDDMEKIILIKSILENPEKESISRIDRVKSKMLSFGGKIKEILGK